MTGRLEGKCALITGAASGIGRACAELFVKEDALVVMWDREFNQGQEGAHAAGDARSRSARVDISVEQEVAQGVKDAVKWLGGLEVLINNAGVGGVGLPEPLEDLPIETWDRTINTNLRGTFLVSRFCLPEIVKSGGGSVVNLVSTYSIVGGPGLGAYCASKGGILALTRNMAIDYAHKNVRVNAIAPGFVDTPMLRDDIAKAADPQATLDEIVARIPQGELMSAEQVARVILFLASDDSAVMTGSLVVADGGYTAQ